MKIIKYFAIIILGCYLSFVGEQNALKFPHLPKVPKSSELNPRVISATIIGAMFFGGFRGIIVNLVWMYIDNLWHQGRFYKLPSLYEIVTTIQPQYIDGWVMGGWHMAYNMSLELPNVKNISIQLRKKIELDWVYRGIDFLKAGSELNPKNAKIYFEIGWTYYHRLKDYQSSIKWFELSAKQKDGLNVTSRLVAFAYEKSGNISMAYKKWLELKSDNQYNNQTSKNIIDRNIKRLNEMMEK
ncbi:hypothetical protein BVX93_01925 [bacterium B13(2017)]|nr:hypothetical protein BVX93_01925 [bacterium B13(2017)]